MPGLLGFLGGQVGSEFGQSQWVQTVQISSPFLGWLKFLDLHCHDAKGKSIPNGGVFHALYHEKKITQNKQIQEFLLGFENEYIQLAVLNFHQNSITHTHVNPILEHCFIWFMQFFNGFSQVPQTSNPPSGTSR